jgi:NAD dependent epimerase/dehydratase
MANSYNWKGKKVVVTGAGGFIGSHLVEALVRSGADVRALVHYNSRSDWGLLEQVPGEVRESIEVVPGDVVDPFQVRQAIAGRDVVFHMAALIGIPYSYAAPQSYVNVNVGGTLNVLEACRSEGVERLVHISTSEVYGTAKYTPIDEDHPLQGQSPYSASKIGADKLAESYHCAFALPVVTARPFNTFGPRQSARAIVPTVISQALSGDHVRLGSLDPIRDMTFVTDTVRGLMALAASAGAVGKTVNLCSGRSQTIGDIARTILRILDSKAELVDDSDRVRPPNSEVLKLEGNPELAQELLDWAPAVDFEEGIARTIEYIRANIHLYKPELYNV